MRHRGKTQVGLWSFAACCLVLGAASLRAQAPLPPAGIVHRSYHGGAAAAIAARSVHYRPRHRAQQRVEAPALDESRLARTERYGELIERYSRIHGMDAALVKAVVYVESGGDPAAVSSQGAVGLMQLMPETGAELGVRDLFDPAQNIDSGTGYLRALLDRFGTLEVALWAYNAGARAVRQNRMPLQTREYVPQVLRVRRYLRQHAAATKTKN